MTFDNVRFSMRRETASAADGARMRAALRVLRLAVVEALRAGCDKDSVDTCVDWTQCRLRLQEYRKRNRKPQKKCTTPVLGDWCDCNVCKPTTEA